MLWQISPNGNALYSKCMPKTHKNLFLIKNSSEICFVCVEHKWMFIPGDVQQKMQYLKHEEQCKKRIPIREMFTQMGFKRQSNVSTLPLTSQGIFGSNFCTTCQS